MSTITHSSTPWFGQTSTTSRLVCWLFGHKSDRVTLHLSYRLRTDGQWSAKHGELEGGIECSRCKGLLYYPTIRITEADASIIDQVIVEPVRPHRVARP
jgi:hypothetical protein